MTRDDFSETVKRNVAERVGRQCSNPYCRALTSGPHTDPEKSVNVGVAGHITAAASGGPRYDATLTRDQRRNAENAIWLCQTCGKLVDSDDSEHTVAELRQWKEKAELRAKGALGRTQSQRDWTPAQEWLTQNCLTFVRPAQWAEACNKLAQHNLLIVTGPPHVGKTETALALLVQAVRDKQLGPIQVLRNPAEFDEIARLRGHAILLDDLFGGSRLDYPGLADRFDDVRRLAHHNTVILTTRQDILEEARTKRRIGSSSLLDIVIVELAQEGSYADTDLQAVLEKHVAFMLNVYQPEERRLISEQADILTRNARLIVSRLRFPHNIERLVTYHVRALRSEEDLDFLIREAREIERAAGQWFDNLEEPHRVLAAVLTLFPGHDRVASKSIYANACAALNIPAGNVQRLVALSGGYIRQGSSLEMAHPSYVKGIFNALLDHELDLAWQLVRQRAAQAAYEPVLELAQCASVVLMLRGQDMMERRLPSPPTQLQTWQSYFTRRATIYNELIRDNFPALRSALYPGGDYAAAIHVSTSPDEALLSWAYIRRLPAEPIVTDSAEAHFMFNRKISEFQLTTREKTGQTDFRWSGVPDTAVAIPEIDAFEDVVGQLADMFGPRSTWAWQRLAETWHLVSERLYRQLRAAHYPVHDISSANPFTEARLKDWIESVPWKPTKVLEQTVNPAEFLKQWPPTMTLNNMYIPTVVSDLKILESAGHPLIGPLLMQPDIDIRDVAWRQGGVSLSDAYSDEHLIRSAEHAIRMLYEAYRASVELNFPTLCRHMRVYRHLPVRVVCVIDRRSPHAFDRPWVTTGVMSTALEDRSNATVIPEIHLISERTLATDILCAEQTRDRIRKWEDEYLWTGSVGAGTLIDGEGWRKSVFDLLIADLDDLLGGLRWRR